jgi:hypothetical protein
MNIAKTLTEVVEDDHGFAHLRESYCDDACAFATIRRGS